MTRTLYLIGVPGSGKSTALAGAAERLGVAELETFEKPIAHAAWYGPDSQFLGVVELGRRRAAFSGTDALAMNAGPRAIEFVRGLAAHTGAPRWIVGEGDRLAYSGFLDACPSLRLVCIDLPVEMAQARMAERAAALGREPQDERWWAGRVTKVRNLCVKYPATVKLDGTLPPEHLAAALAEMLD